MQLLSSVAMLCALVGAQAQDVSGWRMSDRFTGFRFEVRGVVQGVGFRRHVQNVAEQVGGFGWVQNKGPNSVVGEYRGNIVGAETLKQAIRDGPAVAQVESAEFFDYEDTKIRYHFSHFRILEDGRETCFEDAPHACSVGNEASGIMMEL